MNVSESNISSEFWNIIAQQWATKCEKKEYVIPQIKPISHDKKDNFDFDPFNLDDI